MKAQSETVQDALDSMEQMNDRLDTFEEMLLDQSEQIGRLHESVTGVEGGPGGTFPPYCLADIGEMLRGLQLIFEFQLKAKAFEIFDLEANQVKQFQGFFNDQEGTFAEVLKSAVVKKMGLSHSVLERFYAEWKTLRSPAPSPDPAQLSRSSARKKPRG
jgi:hypothetical protein